MLRQRRITTSRAVLFAAMALALAACGAPGATPSPAPRASHVPTTSSLPSPKASTAPSRDPVPTHGSTTCIEGPPTLAAVIAVPTQRRAACFGDAELVLRGWVWDDRGTYDCHAGSGPPSWLSCTADHARLTTAAYEPGDPAVMPMDPADGPLRVAHDPGGAAAAALLPNRWVKVRGRYGDPVTESCAALADPLFEAECLNAFVVSEARIIEFPDVIAPGRSARIAVDELRIRTEPRLSAPPAGALTSDDVVQVLAGPYVFDGHWWYEIGIGSSIEDARRQGWRVHGFVAAGEAESRYLEPLPVDCGRVGSGLAEILAATGYERLECLAGRELTLEGHLPFAEFGPNGSCVMMGEIPSFEPRWLALACAVLQPTEKAPSWQSLALHVAPELAREVEAAVSRRVRITGHFDDPRASRCEDRSTPPVAWGLFYPPMEDAGVVLRCREAFVLTSIQVVDN